MTQKKKTKDAMKILEKRYIRKSEAKKKALSTEREKADIAAQLYEIRTKVGLTQAELARRVGTTQSVISLLEDADYSGHSLSMLRESLRLWTAKWRFVLFAPENRAWRFEFQKAVKP